MDAQIAIVVCAAFLCATIAYCSRLHFAARGQDVTKNVFNLISRQMQLDEAQKTDRSAIGDLLRIVRDIELRITSNYDAIGAVRTELTGAVTKVQDAQRTAEKDANEAATAIKGLWDRCEKNTTALENTAKNLQQTLNEKFTGAALRGSLQKGNPA